MQVKGDPEGQFSQASVAGNGFSSGLRFIWFCSLLTDPARFGKTKGGSIAIFLNPLPRSDSGCSRSGESPSSPGPNHSVCTSIRRSSVDPVRVAPAAGGGCALRASRFRRRGRRTGAPSSKAMGLRPASAGSGNSKGVLAPRSRSWASVCTALSASSLTMAHATLGVLEIRAEVTAWIPAASAAATPAGAAPSPTLSPTTLRLAIFFAESATNWVAPAIARRNEVMAAPGVTNRRSCAGGEVNWGTSEGSRDTPTGEAAGSYSARVFYS